MLFNCLVGDTKGGTFGLHIAGRGVSGLIMALFVPFPLFCCTSVRVSFIPQPVLGTPITVFSPREQWQVVWVSSFVVSPFQHFPLAQLQCSFRQHLQPHYVPHPAARKIAVRPQSHWAPKVRHVPADRPGGATLGLRLENSGASPGALPCDAPPLTAVSPQRHPAGPSPCLCNREHTCFLANSCGVILVNPERACCSSAWCAAAPRPGPVPRSCVRARRREAASSVKLPAAFLDWGPV